MKILYGTQNKNIDVTSICENKLKNNNYIIIPSTDSLRAEYFSDPVYGTLKSIFITDINNITTEYDHKKTIYIDKTCNNIYIDNVPYLLLEEDINKKIKYIHNKLKINYGSFNDELPEQKMVVRYLTGNEKVLEIGGNIGRNSLVISYILMQKQNTQIVVLESNKKIYSQLIKNKDLNNMHFYVENSALSKRNLIQKEWQTIVSDIVLPDYENVNIISYKELLKKYNINFDTLVLDCEGAFYNILIDMPDMLKDIKLIIMENDYNDINHKKYVDNILTSNLFYRDYTESGGWGPCKNNFYEVWKK